MAAACKEPSAGASQLTIAEHPSVMVAHPMGDQDVPLGLDRPLSLLGGGRRLASSEMPSALGIDHVPGLRRFVAEACRLRAVSGLDGYVAGLIGGRVVLEGRTDVVHDYSPASEEGPAPRSMTVIDAFDPPRWLNEHVQARTVEIDGATRMPTSGGRRNRASERLLVNRRAGRDPSLTPIFKFVD